MLSTTLQLCREIILLSLTVRNPVGFDIGLFLDGSIVDPSVGNVEALLRCIDLEPSSV